ncbi:MAG: carboxymuconolactone decarboxylase family protein [Planctomycetes bacterium]|nr:carboxymuconolactone decarboxylase family protein [Planctomycetota bacterium]
MSIARISTVSPASAAGQVKQVYDLLQQHMGRVPNVFQALSARPGLLGATAGMAGAVLLEPGALSRAEKEMIAVVVSAVNRCRY